MTQVLQKPAVSQSLKRGVADVDAKALPGSPAQIGFYEAALHKAKLQASAKSSRAAEHAMEEDEEEESALLAKAEAEAEAQVEAEALLSGVVDAEPPTVLLAANAPAGSDPAKTGTPLFAADNPLSYVLPALLVGTAFGGGGSSSAPATEDHCDIDFTFPNRPTGATVQTVSLAALETEVQAFDDALVLEEGESLVVELGTLSDLSGATTTSGFSGGSNFLVTASGNVGDLYIDVGKSANAFMAVDVSGGVGDIALRTGNDTEGSVNVNVSANGDVGSVTMLAEGPDAGGILNIDTSGGNVGPVELMFANPDGDGSASISAHAVSSGSALVGGNVGDVSLAVEGMKSEGSAYVYASGGNVGDVEVIVCGGGSASAYLQVKAFAQIDGNGDAVGGNVGDLTLVTNGFEVHSDASAFAYGILSGGQYVGGGNIGDVQLTAGGGSGEANATLRSYSGGSIGSIILQVSSLGLESHSASAFVSASVSGAGGQVAAIGDVTMALYGGHDNSGRVDLDAFDGGNIGTITATATGGVSGQFDIYASAYVNDSGSGGNIGAISLTDTSWAGDHAIGLYAESSIGNVSASLGGGSANLTMVVNADVDAVVGTISVEFDEEHYASGGHLYLGLASGATGADITVTGGSITSTFKIIANDDDYGDEYSNGAKVAGDIDMTGFAGFSEIDLNTVEDGVSIDLGSGGSSVLGSLGVDTITLGAGSDQISFNTEFGWLVPSDTTDTITGFDAVLADETDAIDSFYIRVWGGDFIELTSNDVETTLTENSVVTLVDLDLDGGQDLSTLEGLLAALNDDDGEYDLVDGGNGFTHTFATASETSADSFKLFSVYTEWGVFMSGHLLADVTMVTGQTFADLSASNFDREFS